jgi:2'-hydroxyisoflavone reductase
MRLLVLGGTRFLSYEVALEALRRGHQVTCACRGESGALPDGVTHLRWDRSPEAGEPAPDLSAYDVVVDVARHPPWVQRAVAAAPQAHWIFVSSISVYVDSEAVGGTPANSALLEAIHADEDLAEDPEAYGPMKVACEQLVLGSTEHAMVIRPGLIVGPGDPTGRFTYWPVRLADGGEVLAPGAPSDLTQIIDVRDLATWILDSAERRRTGVFDAIGVALPMADLLAQVADGVAELLSDGDFELTWPGQDFLIDQGVAPWAGPASLPMWLPRPDYDGMSARAAQPAIEAGLPLRPISDTARDTLAWVRATPDDQAAEITGIDRDREATLLAAFRR